VYKLLSDPLRAFTGPSHTMVANSAVVAIHTYHCLAFSLTRSEIFHHALFVTILCGLAIPFKQTGGAANNFGCFFLSGAVRPGSVDCAAPCRTHVARAAPGLPGGIDYVLLVLYKQGVISKMAEKKWNAFINTWIRAPPMTVYAFVGWQSWLYATAPDLPTVCIIIVSVLHFYNGQVRRA